jgi:single-strand DNA-binding protein
MGKWYTYEKPQYKETSSMNKIFLLGRIGRDPELKTVGQNQVAGFSVATGFKKADGSQHTDWHNVEAWGKQAELAGKYLRKGCQVMVEGEVRYNTVEKDGKKTTYTKIQASRFEFVGSKQEETAPAPSVDQFDIPDVDPMDLPF